MLQNDDNVNMMLSWCMKYNKTLNTTFLHGIVASQQQPTCNSTIKDHTTIITKKPYILLKDYPKVSCQSSTLNEWNHSLTIL